MDETGFEEEELDQLIELINNRNYFGVDEIMEASSVKGSVRDAFRILPKLTGDVDVLEQAADIAPTVNAGLAIEHLRKMYEMLKMYGVEKYITFDLSHAGKLRILYRNCLPCLYLRNRRCCGAWRTL